jgi:hypothetical protein
MVQQNTDVVCRSIVEYGGQCVLNLSLMRLGWTVWQSAAIRVADSAEVAL